MIKFKLKELLENRETNRWQISKLTDIRPNTITALYNGTAKRIDFDMIDRLCKVLNCRIEDIVEFIPDEDIKQ